MDSDDLANSRPRTRPPAIQNQPFTEANLATASIKQDFRRRHTPNGWLHKLVHLAIAPNQIIWLLVPTFVNRIIACGICCCHSCYILAQWPIPMVEKKYVDFQLCFISFFSGISFASFWTWTMWLQDPLEPVLLFTKPLVPEKLATAGILPPSDPSTKNGTLAPTYKFQGRVGRGGRIVFDRWNPLMHTPIDCGTTYYMPPKPRSSMYS